MAETRINLYEGMFLLNQQLAGADFAASLQFVKDVFTRAEAEVLVLRKWDDRKLAYPVKGQKRGIYVLAFFKARSTQIANIERDCNLSEHVIRNLILKADYVGDVEIELAKKEADINLEAKLRARADDAPAIEPVPEEANIDAPLN